MSSSVSWHKDYVSICGVMLSMVSSIHILHAHVVYMYTIMCTVIVYTLGGIEGILHVPLMCYVFTLLHKV